MLLQSEYMSSMFSAHRMRFSMLDIRNSCCSVWRIRFLQGSHWLKISSQPILRLALDATRASASNSKGAGTSTNIHIIIKTGINMNININIIINIGQY